MANYNLAISVRDLVTGETRNQSAAFTVNNVVPPPPPAGPKCYFGVWDPGNDSGWAGIQKFSAVPVPSATMYLGWLGDFPLDFANLCLQHNAVMYLNLEPWNTWGGGAVPKLGDIASGKYDSYLTSLANSIKSFGHPVLLTFAHEMNGSWYPWGSGNYTPAQWVAAWKHVVTTIDAIAGNYTTWVWCPNNNDVGSVKPYWPGQEFVGLAAYDAYLYSGGTFANFQQSTVNEIRTLTDGPIWNAETGIDDLSGTARLTQYVNDMRNAGLYGFTWFNEGNDAINATQIAALTAAIAAWNNS